MPVLRPISYAPSPLLEDPPESTKHRPPFNIAEVSSLPGLIHVDTRVICRASTNLRQSSRPFSTSTKLMMIIAAVQTATRNGNPIQLFWVLLMMAWTTLGPMMED